jgi:hypothetical protein
MRAGTFYGRRAVVLDPSWKPGKATVMLMMMMEFFLPTRVQVLARALICVHTTTSATEMATALVRSHVFLCAGVSISHVLPGVLSLSSVSFLFTKPALRPKRTFS